MSPSTSVPVHSERIIGDRVYPGWLILPAFRIARRHPVLVVNILVLNARVTRHRLCPMQRLCHLVPLDHQSVDLSSVSRSLVQTLGV